MKLESHLSGRWVAGTGTGRALVNPATGAEIARADATGLDLTGAMDHARRVGGAALGAMDFAARGAVLKAVAGVLTDNRAAYDGFARDNAGNTLADAAIDIDGAIGTLKYYARLGQGLGSARRMTEETRDQLARDPVFFMGHVWTRRPGVAVQINAYNFPAWGLWEKVAVALLAGVPSVAKPATATALLAERMVRDVVAAGVLPEGALSLICGSGEALLDALRPMDSVAFTGSADTGRFIRGHAGVLASGARVTVEADSVNAMILGTDAVPGTPVFDLAVREVVRALSVKAGQMCTNIRRIIVPAELADALAEAVGAQVAGLSVGDPADPAVRVGPLVDAGQRAEAEGRIARLMTEARVIAQAPMAQAPDGTGFVAPRLLLCAAPMAARAVHEVEVFGPVATILPANDMEQAAMLANAGGGSLALSLFSSDLGVQAQVLDAVAPWHGRVMVVDDSVGRAHTGHSIVMPQGVHGGPGRAGGGEELGGLRGLRFHMQRTAVQGGPALLDRLAQEGAAAPP